MGRFSYLCKECGEPVNSDSFSGEHCTIYLLKNGKAIEQMTGQYNSYGAVFKEKSLESIEWKTDEWMNLNELHFNNNKGDGFAVIHSDCQCGNIPTTISDDDPEQGWGKYVHSIRTPKAKETGLH